MLHLFCITPTCAFTKQSTASACLSCINDAQSLMLPAMTSWETDKKLTQTLNQEAKLYVTMVGNTGY